MPDSLLFTQFILRNIRHNRLRFIITLFGIALGIAVMLAIHLSNQAALNHFKSSIDTVSGKSTLSIQSKSTPHFNEQVLQQLTPLWQQNIAYTPVIEQSVILPCAKGQVVQLLGIDLIKDHEFRDTQWQTQNNTVQPDALFEQNQVLITESLSKTCHLQPGKVFSIQSNRGLTQLSVADVMSSTGLSTAYGQQMLVGDISVVQDILELNGQISRIDLRVPAEHVPTIQQSLQQTLPSYLSVHRPKQRGEQVEKMLAAFQSNLTALSYISLLVGMFLIYNTMSIAVLRRRTEIATLRALGATQRTIFKLFLGESLLLGILGNGLGVVLGIAFSWFTLQGISQTVQTLYTGQGITSFNIAWPEVALSFGLGLLLTVLATLQPLLEAATIPPSLGMRTGSFESRLTQLRWIFLVAGLLLAGLSVWCALQPPINNQPIWGYISAFLIFASASLCLPVWIHQKLYRLRQLLGRFSTHSHIALSMLQGALGRSTLAIASLMIGLAMLISLSIMIASFRETVVIWVNQTLKADLFIEPETHSISKNIGSLTPRAAEYLKTLRGVKAVDAFYDIAIEYEGSPARLGAGDIDVLADNGHLTFLSGQPSKQVLTQLARNPGLAIMSESFANRHHVKPGQYVTLPLPGSPQVKIADTYFDYSSDNGYIIVAKPLLQKSLPQLHYSSFAVYLNPGIRPEALLEQMTTYFSQQHSPVIIRTNKGLREEVLRIFDNTFAITYALHAVAMAVALLSILNTLFMLVLESQHEFKLLKQMGFSVNDIRNIIIQQALVLGLLGFIAGLVVGIVMALLLIFVINKQSFGWSIQLFWPSTFLIQSGILTLLTAALAGILPARLALQSLESNGGHYE